MGHGYSESSPQVCQSAPPPDPYNRRRQDYIHRLGIKRDGKRCISSPSAQLETPEKTCRKMRSTPEKTCRKARSTECAQDADCEPVEDEAAAVECLDLSSQDDFRLSFLRKLSYKKVWVPKTQRPPSHQTVIIFDWDDTLLCTSYLNNLCQLWNLPTAVEEQLQLIGKMAQQLLELSLRMGHTFIITNAAPMWVQYSAAKWIPDLLPTLEKVRVISARGKHEADYPNDVGQWKMQAFLDVQRQLDSEVITNLVSLGDSVYEMNATHNMAKQFDLALIKTIKFHENPCPEALLKQLQLVAAKFERIVENARNMKINLERRRE